MASKSHSRDSIVRALWSYAARFGKQPAASVFTPSNLIRAGREEELAWWQEIGAPYIGTIVHHFGSYNAAIETAFGDEASKGWSRAAS